MAGFCELATSLRAPILGILGAKWPIVSGGQLKNSRFWEIAAGDRVQSALRGRACSATRQILRLPPANWERQARTAASGQQCKALHSPPRSPAIGNVEPGLPRGACSATRHSPLWHLANWVCQAGTVAAAPAMITVSPCVAQVAA